MRHAELFALMVTFLLAVVIRAPCGGARENSTAVRLTVATVNNPDMLIMQRLSAAFTASTGIGLNFVVLPENELRQKVTEDVSLGSGKYDVVTIGTARVWRGRSQKPPTRVSTNPSAGWIEPGQFSE